MKLRDMDFGSMLLFLQENEIEVLYEEWQSKDYEFVIRITKWKVIRYISELKNRELKANDNFLVLEKGLQDYYECIEEAVCIHLMYLTL